MAPFNAERNTSDSSRTGSKTSNGKYESASRNGSTGATGRRNQSLGPSQEKKRSTSTFPPAANRGKSAHMFGIPRKRSPARLADSKFLFERSFKHRTVVAMEKLEDPQMRGRGAKELRMICDDLESQDLSDFLKTFTDPVHPLQQQLAIREALLFVPYLCQRHRGPFIARPTPGQDNLLKRVIHFIVRSLLCKGLHTTAAQVIVDLWKVLDSPTVFSSLTKPFLHTLTAPGHKRVEKEGTFHVLEQLLDNSLAEPAKDPHAHDLEEFSQTIIECLKNTDLQQAGLLVLCAQLVSYNYLRPQAAKLAYIALSYLATNSKVPECVADVHWMSGKNKDPLLLTKEIAQTCCTLLGYLAKYHPEQVTKYQLQVRELLSRDNLDLFRLTSKNEALRKSISIANQEWAALRPLSPKIETRGPPKNKRNLPIMEKVDILGEVLSNNGSPRSRSLSPEMRALSPIGNQQNLTSFLENTNKDHNEDGMYFEEYDGKSPHNFYVDPNDNNWNDADWVDEPLAGTSHRSEINPVPDSYAAWDHIPLNNEANENDAWMYNSIQQRDPNEVDAGEYYYDMEPEQLSQQMSLQSPPHSPHQARLSAQQIPHHSPEPARPRQAAHQYPQTWYSEQNDLPPCPVTDQSFHAPGKNQPEPMIRRVSKKAKEATETVGCAQETTIEAPHKATVPYLDAAMQYVKDGRFDLSLQCVFQLGTEETLMQILATVSTREAGRLSNEVAQYLSQILIQIVLRESLRRLDSGVRERIVNLALHWMEQMIPNLPAVKAVVQVPETQQKWSRALFMLSGHSQLGAQAARLYYMSENGRPI